MARPTQPKIDIKNLLGRINHSVIMLPELVDNGDAAIPELFLVRLDEERLEGVADLVPHVAV